MAETSVARSDIDVRIIRSPTEFAMAMAVRAAVFLAEEDITYADEFNGNDYAGTQFLALVNGDPAGVMRCRWFAQFALLERVGIRRRYRCFAVLRALVDASLDLSWQKGYRMVAGRARGDIAKFWFRRGGVQSGPVQTHRRGLLVPIVLGLNDRPNIPTVPFGPFGDAQYETLIAQEEGNWDFSQFEAPNRVAAE